MCKLTVFTATYNRGHLIENLYRSLQRQKIYNFEWLVIDDGSTDNTRDLFSKWIKEDNSFQIRYFYQENQGLIRSLNLGIELAKGEFISKIDSDDYVCDDFAINMQNWLESIRDEESIYGVSGIRIRPDGNPIKGCWPQIECYVDATDLDRKKYDLDADMCEGWKTEVLRKYPFPVWENEKFAPEQIVFYQIALDGFKIRWYPIAMSVCEYQEGGLTLGASKLEKQNPMGYAMMYNQNLILHSSLKQNYYDAAQMIALTICGGHIEYLLHSNKKLVTILALPVGVLLGLRRKMQFSKIS